MKKLKKTEKPISTDLVFRAMQHCVDHHERTAPVAFVGRDEVMDSLLSAVQTTAAFQKAKGMTRVVHGVPGAGKTAICDEFVRRYQNERIALLGADGGEKEASVFCVVLAPDDLDSPPITFAQAIHEAWRKNRLSLGTGLGNAALGHLDKAADLTRSALNRSTEHETVERVGALTEHSGLSTCLGAYCDDYWGDEIVIALCIDEVQNCPATDRAKAILGGLHNRTHPARIVPLLFGLPNATDHLDDLGLSRLNVGCVHEICLLEPGQSREIVDGTFAKLGLEWSNPGWGAYLGKRGFSPVQWNDWRSRIAGTLAEGSSDFPQHVTLGLSAAFQELIDRRKTLSPNGLDELIQNIRAKHQERKEIYYHRRIRSIIEHGPAIGAICRKASRSPHGSLSQVEARQSISAGSAADGQRLTREEASKVLQTALEKGILGKLENGRITPPAIPSMTTYLDGLLQEAIDLEDRLAMQACQSIGLSANAAAK